MKYRLLLFLIMSTIIIICSITQAKERKHSDLTKYVNPLIGTAKSTTIAAMRHGSGTENNAQVYPAVTVPFGMTNWTPQTQTTENKCVSPYYYKDTLINGFRGSHWMSGSCTQDYGTFAVMPISGKLICNQVKRGSHYSHSKEIAGPDFYKINLEDYNIVSEMTATKRCGIIKFTFNKAGEAHIVINPNNDHSEGSVKVIPEKREIVGSNPIHRIYQGWGKPAGFSGHFVLRIERSINNFGVYTEDEVFEKQVTLSNKPNLGAFFSFKVKRGEVVYVKIGTSFVGTEQARKNLDSEIPEYEFTSTRNNLSKTWNDLLSKISVEGNSLNDKVKFYTAMYHSFQQPRLYNDVDGAYPRFDGNAKTDTIKNGNYYCDFSLWDTYRALHPLYNILIPEQNADMLRSLLTMAKVGGWLPIFPKWNSYTAAMIGDHAIAIIAEAYIKDVLNLTEDDYQILKKNATETPATFSEYADGKGRRALKSYLEYGYVPLEDSVKEAFHKNEQVSRTLEYSYDDFALAQVAKKMGKQEDYNYFAKRSQNYHNVFDPSVHNMNGRFANGTFTKNFIKDAQMPYITEGTPWQYNWYVPQDVNGLIDLMGGKESFNKELDKFFKVGQYWHGNEPSHQISFLYNYSGQPWKTQEIVANTMNIEYGVGPGGLSGNDDAGQMSAWYVLGAIGFYPVSPVSAEYQISGPKFKKITMKLNSGKSLVINAPNYTSENIFINKLVINGTEYDSYTVSHQLLMNGGVWDYDMSKCSKE